MQILDNVSAIVRDDLRTVMKKGSRISIAATCFSIYAYQELKNELEKVEEPRFIFTSPAFVKEKTPKASREFYIPRLNREKSLYGTEFEVKLQNELTQKAIAKKCADWISRKPVFRSNVTQEQMMGFMTVDESTYMPINGFTTVDLGCERSNNAYYPVQKTVETANSLWFSYQNPVLKPAKPTKHSTRTSAKLARSESVVPEIKSKQKIQILQKTLISVSGY